MFSLTHSCHVVRIHEVDSAEKSNSFLNIYKASVPAEGEIGDDSKNDDGDGDVTMESEKHYFLTCSCAAFKHTANYGTETIAVAASLGLIDIDMLIDDIAARNGVGRKQTKIKGLGRAKKAGAVPKTHKPEYFYDALKKQMKVGQNMTYHKWCVAVEDEAGYVCCGVVNKYRKLPSGPEKGKAVWAVTYDLGADGNDLEELDARALATALSRAYQEGKGGPSE